MRKSILLIIWFYCLTAVAQDSLNVEMVGRIDYWDDPYKCAIYENYLFVTVSGAGLRVLDVSNPEEPEEVWSKPAYNIAFEVTVWSHFAYVADVGLYVLDISNPESPEQLDYLPYASFMHSVRAVAVDGNYAYCAGYDNLSVVNISDPNNMQIISSTSIVMNDVYAIEVDDGYVYISNHLGYKIFDVSDPVNPSLIYANGEICGDGMQKIDNYLYIAGEGGLYILDVSQPDAPYLVSSLSSMEYYDIHIIDNIAYLSAGDYGLRIINITNPQYPFEVGSFEDESFFAWRIVADQGVAYISCYNWFVYDYFSGIKLMDVTRVFNPIEFSSFSRAAFVGDVVYQQGYLYYTVSSASEGCFRGIIVADVSDPYFPEEILYIPTPSSPSLLAVQDDILYVTVVDSGIYLYNIVDPLQTALMNTIQSPMTFYDIRVRGDYLYAACYDDDFVIYDVANPYSPALLSSTPVSGYATDITLDDEFAIVANNGTYNDRIFDVVDITDPANPVVISTYYDQESANDIEVTGDYVHYSTESDIITVSINNPITPTFFSEFEDLSHINRLTYCEDSGNDFFITTESFFGFYILEWDIISPAVFTIAGYYDTPSKYPGRIDFDEQYLYLADYYYLEVFACPEVVSVDGNRSVAIPSSFTISPPHPNPFNPTTTINFELPVASEVKLSVFDINGRLVSGRHQTGPYAAGTNSITLDGSGLSSGIYIYQLQAGDFSASGKMVLLK